MTWVVCSFAPDMRNFQIPKLAHVESEPGFDIARLMEAESHQRLQPDLARRTAECGEERAPFRCNFRVWRQARDIDKTLGVGDGLLVERSDPHRQRVDKSIEFGVRQSTIDVAIKLGEIASNIVCAEQHFQRASPANEPGSRAIGPPPGTSPAPTSHCDRMAFSRLAKRMSLASASSLPTPVARPRIITIDTTGARLKRASMSGSACKPVRPTGRRVESSSFARKS